MRLIHSRLHTLARFLAGCLLFTSFTATGRDICNCKGYDGPGGPAYSDPGGACYSGPGGPRYDGPGGPCYSGPGGTGAGCPAVCK